MSVAVRRDRPMRVAEFLAFVADTPDKQRWELVDGAPVLMAPPRERHQALVANLLAALRPLCEAKGCRALPGLGILSDAADDYAPIPDVVVRCGPLLEGGYVRDPVLVAEVLSPSTACHDRILKAGFYLTLPSLRHFLIVDQAEARVEAWQRADTEWTYRAARPGETIPLPGLGGALDVAAVYAGIPIDPA